jgi:hypothetical protein
VASSPASNCEVGYLNLTGAIEDGLLGASKQGGSMRTIITLVLAFFAILVMFSTASPTVRADEWDQMTRVTLNHPIEIPGHKVLPAGTYWLALADHGYLPDIVVIYNADQDKLEATLLTRPAYRMIPTSQTQFTMVEQRGKAPDALLTWFYPGRDYGHVFIYSSQLQKRLDEDTRITMQASPIKSDN